MRNFFKAIVVALLLSASSVHADEVKPSVESIREIFVVTNTKAILNSMQGQIDSMMKTVMEQATKDAPMTPAQQQALDKFRQKAQVIFSENFTWEKLEPVYIDIYSKSLTQADVDGILAFYKSPAGQALVTKMPVIVQNSMSAVQTMIKPMMEKLQVASSELQTDLKNASGKKPKK